MSAAAISEAAEKVLGMRDFEAATSRVAEECIPAPSAGLIMAGRRGLTHSAASPALADLAAEGFMEAGSVEGSTVVGGVGSFQTR